MKKGIALLLALGIMNIFAACDWEDGRPTEPKYAATLNVVTTYGSNDGNRSTYEAAIQDFIAETNIWVNDNSDNANEAFKSQVLADFETGSEPDVLFFFTNADAAPFVNQGKVVSIDEIRTVYPEYAANMKDSMFTLASDGKSYAVPSYGFWEQMFVNKDVLEAAGVAIPGPFYSWEHFLADCQKIKDAGYTPIAVSLAEIPHYWFEYCVMNNGSLADHLEIPELDEDGKLVDNAAARKWIAGLEDIKELYQRGFLPDNTLTAIDTETCQMIYAGEAAFLLDGSWKCGGFAENCGGRLDRFTVVNVPCKGQRRCGDIVSDLSSGYFITRKAWEDPEKRDAAVRLVEYMTSREVLAKFVKTEVTALREQPISEGLTSLERDALKLNAHVTGTVSAVQDIVPSTVMEALFRYIPLVVTGEMTAADAVAAALMAA